MTEISYKIIGGFGECLAFKAGKSSTVKISIEDAEDGIIEIGPKAKRLLGGVCYLSLSELLDGDYSPTLSIKKRRIPLGAIRKMGDKLTRPPLDTAIASRLFLRLEAAEKRIEELEGRISSLENDVHGTPIFTN